MSIEARMSRTRQPPKLCDSIPGPLSAPPQWFRFCASGLVAAFRFINQKPERVADASCAWSPRAGRPCHFSGM